MAQSRKVFRPSMEVVAEALRPFAAAAYFVEFTTKLNVMYVKQYAGLLAALHHVAPTLAFQPKIMEKGIDLLYSSAWGLAEVDRRSWGCTMGKRIRRLCKYAMQAKLKSGGVLPA